jgi:hypothetical protein
MTVDYPVLRLLPTEEDSIAITPDSVIRASSWSLFGGSGDFSLFLNTFADLLELMKQEWGGTVGAVANLVPSKLLTWSCDGQETCILYLAGPSEYREYSIWAEVLPKTKFITMTASTDATLSWEDRVYQYPSQRQFAGFSYPINLFVSADTCQGTPEDCSGFQSNEVA